MAGAPLLTIGPRNDLEITVDLLSTDAVRIAPGARAYVERWGGDDGAGGGGARDRAGRLHQGLGARHRGATGQGAARFHHARKRAPGARPQLPGLSAGRRMVGRRRAARPDQRAVPRRRRLGGVHASKTARRRSQRSRSAGATPKWPRCWAGSPPAKPSSPTPPTGSPRACWWSTAQRSNSPDRVVLRGRARLSARIPWRVSRPVTAIGVWGGDNHLRRSGP